MHQKRFAKRASIPVWSKNSNALNYRLGLAIAAEIVHAHGGEIALVDRPGAGAVFQITLPDRPGDIRTARKAQGA